MKLLKIIFLSCVLLFPITVWGQDPTPTPPISCVSMNRQGHHTLLTQWSSYPTAGTPSLNLSDTTITRSKTFQPYEISNSFIQWNTASFVGPPVSATLTLNSEFMVWHVDSLDLVCDCYDWSDSLTVADYTEGGGIGDFVTIPLANLSIGVPLTVPLAGLSCIQAASDLKTYVRCVISQRPGDAAPTGANGYFDDSPWTLSLCVLSTPTPTVMPTETPPPGCCVCGTGDGPPSSCTNVVDGSEPISCADDNGWCGIICGGNSNVWNCGHAIDYPDSFTCETECTGQWIFTPTPTIIPTPMNSSTVTATLTPESTATTTPTPTLSPMPSATPTMTDQQVCVFACQDKRCKDSVTCGNDLRQSLSIYVSWHVCLQKRNWCTSPHHCPIACRHLVQWFKQTE